ncbi:MAG TPA: xanthine dehydrogenase family protein subunit M [Acidimicrobiia bacterium]|nr:xanthine dehydrogenase family protein subunit M [Acidimicrobiia bacterium]
MKPPAFEYHAPASIDEAVTLLAGLGDGAKVLAGGQSLVPLLSLRLAYFDHLVDVGRIAELRGIRNEPESVLVGAATVDAEIERDGELATRLPLLARVTPFIGHFQIRNRGTVGGSIAHADPAAEYPAVARALDAEMEVASPNGRRRVTAREFFRGFWTTALERDELLVSVRFPVWHGRCGFGVREFARRHGDFAIAGAVVAVQLGTDDRIERCAIGLFGLGSTPLRATAAEEAALGAAPDLATAEIGRLAVTPLGEVPSDLHGSARYRRRVGAAMVERALNDAMEEATRG